MKQITIFMFTLLAMASCNTFDEEGVTNNNTNSEGVEVLLSINSSDDNLDGRLSFETDEDSWITKWEESDNIGLWQTSAEEGKFSKFSVVSGTITQDGTGAEFTGVARNDDARILYPYDSRAGVLNAAGLYEQFDLTEQTFDMASSDKMSDLANKMHLISDVFTIVDGEVKSTINLRYLTAALKIKMKFTNLTQGVNTTIKSVKFYGSADSSITSSGKINFSTEVVEDLGYDPITISYANSQVLTESYSDGTDDFYTTYAAIYPYELLDGHSLKFSVTLQEESLQGGDAIEKTVVCYTSANDKGNITLAEGKTHEAGFVCDLDNALASTSFESGSGAELDPYIISTPEHLQNLGAIVESGESTVGVYYKLKNEIDLAGANWTPIGTSGCGFSGSFDGNNQTIKGITIDSEGAQYQALFGALEKDGKIFDLTTRGEIKIKSSTIFGGVVALNNGGVIKNCHNYCNLTLDPDSEDTPGVMGGIVGQSVAGEINGCTNNGTISGATNSNSSASVGGIVGETTISVNLSTIVTGCSNNGAVSGDQYVGGIAGYSRAVVTDSTNTGEISGGTRVGGAIGYIDFTTFSEYRIAAQGLINEGGITSTVEQAGGICGALANGVINYCENRAAIAGPKNIGGILGLMRNNVYSAIVNCLNNSGGTVVGQNNSGGIVGMMMNAATITVNSCNLADILAKVVDTPQTSSTDRNTGGIVGYMAANTTVNNCYTTGTIKGYSYVAAVVGNTAASAYHYNNYYLESCATLYTDPSTYLDGIGGSTNDSEGVVESKTDGYMKSGDFAIALNAKVTALNDAVILGNIKLMEWSADGAYPSFINE